MRVSSAKRDPTPPARIATFPISLKALQDIPNVLWGCQITCGIVGTWTLKGRFLNITIIGKSSFYLIWISENEYIGIGHISFRSAKCSLYKIQ